MNKREWKKVYKDTLIKRGGITNKQAEEDYQAGKDMHDYDDDPISQAADNMSYWN
jgi:hypothetical protein